MLAEVIHTGGIIWFIVLLVVAFVMVYVAVRFAPKITVDPFFQRCIIGGTALLFFILLVLYALNLFGILVIV